MPSAALTKALRFQELWTEAYARVSMGESYTFTEGNMSRTLTRVDAEVCLQMMNFWDSRVAGLQSGQTRPRTRYAVPMDGIQ